MRDSYKAIIVIVPTISTAILAFIFVFQPFNRVTVLGESITGDGTKILTYNKYAVKVKVALTSAPNPIHVKVLVNGITVYEHQGQEIYYLGPLKFGKNIIQIVIQNNLEWGSTQVLGQVWLPLF